MTNRSFIRGLNALACFLVLMFTNMVTSNAQTGIHLPETAGIDSVMNSFINRWKINGMSVAIAKDGRLIYNRGFGYRNAARTEAAQPGDLYRIASISKPITAAGIMKLVESGSIRLTDKVFGRSAILNQPYYLSAIADPRIYQITVKDLLEHTAGWDRRIPYGPYGHSDAPFFPLHVAQTQEESNPVGDSTLIRFMLGSGLNNAPGKSYSYSNVGYLILGKIIERISGMPYETFIKKNILEPTGAFDTHLGKNLPQNKLERETEYMFTQLERSVYGNGELVPTPYGGFNLEAMNAHGGWVSSAEDLCRFLNALEGYGAAGPILNSETKQLMFSASELNNTYAKGWSVNSKGNKWHTGSLDGTSAYVCTTADGYSWAILLNGRSDNSTAYWESLDRLPWTALKTLKSIPMVNLFSPAENVKNIQVTHVDSLMYITMESGNGDGRLIIASTDSTLQFYPEHGRSYDVKNTRLTNSYVKILYKGEKTKVTLKKPDTVLYITAYEYFRNEDTKNKEVYRLAGRTRYIVSNDKGPLLE